MSNRGSVAAGITVAVAGGGLALYARTALAAAFTGVTGWDVVFDVVANPIFLGQIVLTAWLLLVTARLPRLTEPTVGLRFGSRLRITFIDGLEGLRQVSTGAALVAIALFAAATGSSWRGWSAVSTTPGSGLWLAQQDWAPAPLLLWSIAQVVCVLLAVRLAAVTIAQLAGSMPAICFMAAIWLLEALSTLEVSAGIPILHVAATALSADRSAQAGLRPGAVLVAVIAVAAACWMLLRRVDRARDRERRPVTAVAGVAVVLIGLALAGDAMSRRPRTLTDAAATLLAGHSNDLIAYLLYSSVGLGYALIVMHQLEDRFDGRVWQELIRTGTWTRWLRRRVGPMLLRIPVYLAALLLLVLLVSASADLAASPAELPVIGVAYFIGGSLQIALYTAVVVTVTILSGEIRWAWITACGFFLVGSPFLPDTHLLPVGLYTFDAADPTWAPVLQHLLVLSLWAAIGAGALVSLTRKRVLHVAV